MHLCCTGEYANIIWREKIKKMKIEEIMVIDKMAQWRPDDWKNPYGLPGKVKDEQWAYEEGATAMLKTLMMQQLNLKEK